MGEILSTHFIYTQHEKKQDFFLSRAISPQIQKKIDDILHTAADERTQTALKGYKRGETVFEL